MVTPIVKADQKLEKEEEPIDEAKLRLIEQMLSRDPQMPHYLPLHVKLEELTKICTIIKPALDGQPAPVIPNLEKKPKVISIKPEPEESPYKHKVDGD